MASIFIHAKVRLATLAITILAHALILGLLVNFKFKPENLARQELDAEIFFVKSEPTQSLAPQKFEKTQTLFQSDAVTDKAPASMAAPPAWQPKGRRSLGISLLERTGLQLFQRHKIERSDVRGLQKHGRCQARIKSLFPPQGTDRKSVV